MYSRLKAGLFVASQHLHDNDFNKSQQHLLISCYHRVVKGQSFQTLPYRSVRVYRRIAAC